MAFFRVTYTARFGNSTSYPAGRAGRHRTPASPQFVRDIEFQSICFTVGEFFDEIGVSVRPLTQLPAAVLETIDFDPPGERGEESRGDDFGPRRCPSRVSRCPSVRLVIPAPEDRMMGKGITYVKIPRGRHFRASGNPGEGYLLLRGTPLVAPAKAGVQGKGVLWIPAFAGMTKGGRTDNRG